MGAAQAEPFTSQTYCSPMRAQGCFVSHPHFFLAARFRQRPQLAVSLVSATLRSSPAVARRLEGEISHSPWCLAKAQSPLFAGFRKPARARSLFRVRSRHDRGSLLSLGLPSVLSGADRIRQLLCSVQSAKPHIPSDAVDELEGFVRGAERRGCPLVFLGSPRMSGTPLPRTRLAAPDAAPHATRTGAKFWVH